MKSSETDRDLADLIIKTLDEHEEHYILGSWESFVKARKRRLRILFWFSATGIAATIMIGLIGFRMLFPVPSTGKTAGNAGHVFPDSAAKYKEMPAALTALSDPSGKKIKNIVKSYSGSGDKGSAPSEGNEVASQPGVAGIKTPQSLQVIKENLRYSAVAGLEFHHSPGVNKDLIRNRHSGDPGNSTILNEDHSGIIVANNDQDAGAGTRRLRFGVNIAPGMTSTGTVTSFNYAGGINADYEITDKLHLSTGLQLEHQNAINKNTDSPSWIPAGQSQALLTDLDLPLNITWKFLKKGSSRYYVTGGISSVACLTEKYVSTTYTQKMEAVVNSTSGSQSLSYQLVNVKSTSTRTEEPLNSVNFAGRVNIIFGFEQHLSTKLSLHIEPFVKIPVTGLGSEDMKFTTSGVACKISF
ncbi:MAG TPA: hypothetical protein VMT63_12675 [Bacteroidales bacterium]|nr:hypothetical protein [Bacteroidales bacterium]